MDFNGAPRRKSRRLDGTEAAAYPRFDLLREQRQREAFLARLDALRRPVGEAAALLYRRMFNNGSIQLSASTWQQRAPEADFWLAATTVLRPGQVAYFGFSASALFALSELFFGGATNLSSAGDNPDAAHSQRNVSETEERLARRLFLYHATELARALGLESPEWEIHSVTAPPAEVLPCCDIAFSSDQLQCSWQLCWPEGLDVASATAFPPDLDRKLRHALVRIPVRLRIEVAAMATVLGKLGSLRAGEVLPLELHDQAVARVGEVKCCRGRMAEDGGELVLQVTDVMGAADD